MPGLGSNLISLFVGSVFLAKTFLFSGLQFVLTLSHEVMSNSL